MHCLTECTSNSSLGARSTSPSRFVSSHRQQLLCQGQKYVRPPAGRAHIGAHNRVAAAPVASVRLQNLSDTLHRLLNQLEENTRLMSLLLACTFRIFRYLILS